MKLFSKPGTKDNPPKIASIFLDQAEQDEMDNTGAAWQEDLTETSFWDTVSTKAPIPAAMSTVSPAELATEPTLQDILSAVTSCNTAITALTTEIKVIKLKINLVRHDMQKLCDHTTALEGRLSNVEN